MNQQKHNHQLRLASIRNDCRGLNIFYWRQIFTLDLLLLKHNIVWLAISLSSQMKERKWLMTRKLHDEAWLGQPKTSIRLRSKFSLELLFTDCIWCFREQVKRHQNTDKQRLTYKSKKCDQLYLVLCEMITKIVSEYDQKIPQLQTAYSPVAS